MVYCSKCGFKNEEGAEVCSKCKASLEVSRPIRRSRRHRRMEDECFGLPQGRTIVGLLIGIIVILWGISQVPGIFPEGFEFWWLILIVIGALMIAGSIYRFGRGR